MWLLGGADDEARIQHPRAAPVYPKKRFVVCSWFQGLEDLRENSLKCLQMFVVSSFSARKYEPSSVLLEENRPRKIYDSTFELSETSKRPIFIFSIINQVCRP